MEVTRGYSHAIDFSVPSDSVTLSYVVKRGTEIIKTSNTSQVDGVAQVTLPFLNVEEILTIELKFYVGSVESIIVQEIKVVTPYLNLIEVKKIMPDDTDDDDAWAAESVIRNNINAICGQTFGYRRDTLWAYPAGTKLELSEQLDSIISINGIANTQELSHNGRFLSGFGLDYLEIKHAPPEYELDVIRTPFYWHARPVPVQIEGFWGYKTVPTPIKIAAKIMLEDYACQDSAYRDKYIEMWSHEDWRVAFNSRAFTSTGNVRSDQLIEEYKTVGFIVV